jgi:DNA-binding NarL/FixJ family response regulator
VADQRLGVVLVDVDDGFRTFLSAVLERAGYKTVGVSSAEEAFVAIAESRPEVVLTDVQLPGVSGYELCRQLKDEHGDRLAVVIVTGDRTEPFDRAAGILLGADDYMVKPVDAGELVARVWRLAGRSDGPRQSQSHSPSGKLDVLSARERQVLDLLAGGSNQEEIAEALFISSKTVATHIQRVLTKLGVRSRTEAVVLALGRGSDVRQREQQRRGEPQVALL